MLDKQYVIKDAKDFIPRDIFECGQCFRWDKEEDGSYTGVVEKSLINVSKKGNDIILKGADEKDYNEFWKNYFDMGTDYSDIKSRISKNDENLKKATEFGSGIRILNQPFHEILISFIISARNGIPAIKKAILNLSEKYGDYVGTYNGKEYYSFPDMKTLANANEIDVQNCKTGFRAKYIIQSAKKVLDDNISDKDFINKDLDETNTILQEFSGVGPKVAGCIALFSLKKHDSFPVDVWINRIMNELYFKGEELSLKKLGEKSRKLLGKDAGYAQQYLFYYARENGIGKEKK